MEKGKDGKNGFIFYEEWLTNIELLCRNDKQIGECLYALCKYAFRDEEYELGGKHKNKYAAVTINSARHAILEQRKKYLKNRSNYNNNNKDKNNNNNNINTTSDDESKKRFRERENIYLNSTRKTLSDEEKEEINAQFRNEK